MDSGKFYCRICFTNTERFLRPINNQIRDSFHSLTSINLMKSDTYSNLICGKCDKRIIDTKKYCDELKSNELQLMGKLDEIVIEEAQDQLQISQISEFNLNQSQTQSQSSLLDVDEPKVEINLNPLEVSQLKLEINPLDDVGQSQDEIILIQPDVSQDKEVLRHIVDEIKQEEEEICEFQMPIESSKSDDEEFEEILIELSSIDDPESQSKSSEVTMIKLVEVKRNRKQKLVPRKYQKLNEALKASQKPKKDSKPPCMPKLIPDITKLPPHNFQYRKPKKIRQHPYHKNPELDKEIENLPETSDGKVKCSRCSLKLFKVYYRQHTERVHLNIKNFTCDRCGKKFYLFSTLEEHMNLHLNLKPFECPKCGECFARKNSVSEHVKLVHENSEYICEICAMRFKQRHLLKDHILVKHEGHRYRCHYPDCGSEYQLERSLNTHIEDKHEIRMEPCEVCGKVLRAGTQLFHHRQRYHFAKNLACQYCGKIFRLAHELRKHEPVHLGVRNFPCKLCDKAFFRGSNLNKHMLENHMGQRFHCTVSGCSSNFTNKTTYRDHIKTVHKNFSPAEVEEWLEIVRNSKPTYEVSREELGCFETRKKRGR